MRPNTIGPILIIILSVASMWGRDAAVPSPDSFPPPGSVVAPSNCAHTVLTASKNLLSPGQTHTPSDMKSAGIGAGQ